MSKPLRVLVLEDSAIDAEVIIRELRRGGFEPQWKRVQTEANYLAELDAAPDLILADYSLPRFDGLRAAILLRERGLDIPFILISGTVGEEAAVEAMKHGANDYLLKDRIVRLGPAVERALEEKRLRDGRRHAEEKLRQTHRQLQHLLEHSPVVIYSLKVEGERVIPQVVSENITRLLGFTVEEARSFDWWAAHLHAEDQERQFASIPETLERDRFACEYRLRHKDGHYVWVEDSRRTVRDATGKPVQIAGAWTDITERKRAEEISNQRIAELERFHRLSVGREWQMIELKKEVNELAKLAGRTPPYDVSFLENDTAKTGTGYD